MPFCTTCGASVSGPLCNRCRTRVSEAAHAPVKPYAQSDPSGDKPTKRKNSSMIIGFLVLGGSATVGIMELVSHRPRQPPLNLDRGRNGGLSFRTGDTDGKDASVELGTSVAELPSWVPVYPGSEGHATFALTGSGNGEGEGGSFTFTTSDDGARVKSFYADRFRDLGMKVSLDTSTLEGGTVVAADEGGGRRSLTIVVGNRGGQTVVNLTYGLK